jgi:serine/threonine protein kinase
MADLPKGYTIKTKNFKTVVVDHKLGEGGQGAVYRVSYEGEAKALKWYSGKKFKEPKRFYENLVNNIEKGKPTSAFLWPEDVTQHKGEAFGYIMGLRPGEYKDFTRFLIGKEGFASTTAMVNSSLHIVAGFRALHQKGYSYQDLNDGNFFINPKNGDVLICDNDNVSEYGKKSGIIGKPRYMAPEIVAKGKAPDMKTDAYSLAVVLFLLWVASHPLEGKAACPPCMDAKNEKRIYGESPVFVWDPNDNSNRPVQGIHRGAIIRWPLLPEYLRETFEKAFSKEALTDPMQRVIEQDWLRLFIRMRSEIYKCSGSDAKPCSEVYFADPVNPNPCFACQKKNEFPFYIKTYRYNLPVHQRTKLYTCHTEKDSDNFEELAGEVSAKGSEFELKNASDKNWTLTDDGKTTSVAPNEAFALKKGMSIGFGSSASAEVI